MFSVILPTYNSACFLKQAIDSVLAQQEKDWELIVVDDGSTDETQQVLEEYRSWPRVRIIKQSNQGASVARNCGITVAEGEYITFLDADDLWREDHLTVMKKLIQRYPDAGLYGSFTQTELVNGKTITTCHYFQNHPETVYLEDFFDEYRKDKSVKMFTVITTCVSSRAVEKVGGFPIGCRIGEDLEFSLRVAAYFPVVLTRRITATYRKKNSQATKRKSFDPDWSFFQGVKSLYDDPSISPNKKAHIKEVMEWFSMRRCRHYLIGGERGKAWAHLADMGKNPAMKKDRWLTYLLLFLPTPLVRRLFEVRWRGKA